MLHKVEAGTIANVYVIPPPKRRSACSPAEQNWPTCWEKNHKEPAWAPAQLLGAPLQTSELQGVLSPREAVHTSMWTLKS